MTYQMTNMTPNGIGNRCYALWSRIKLHLVYNIIIYNTLLQDKSLYSIENGSEQNFNT